MAWCAGVAAALLLLGGIALAADTADDTAQPLPGDLAERIAALGSDAWDEREAATQAILEIGPSAAPALRGIADHPDPEVRSRVEWLLSVLVPPVFEVEVVELGGAAPPFAPVQWIRLVIPERSTGEGESRAAEGPGRRLHVSITGERPPYRVEISIGVERGQHVIAAEIPLDVVALIEREESFATEDSLGRVRVEREHAVWVARLARSDGPPPERPQEDRESIVRSVEGWIRAGLAADDERAVAALRAAAAWRRLDLLPPLDGSRPALRRETALARFVAGDAAARSALEEVHEESIAGVDPLPPPIQDEATLALAAAGFEPAIERLIGRLGESSLWVQHQGCGILAGKLADPAFMASHGRRILAGILTPGRTAGIHWQDGVVVSLLQELQDRMPPVIFAQGLAPALGECLDDDGGAAGNRVQVMLRILLRSLRETPDGEGLALETWFEPVQRLLAGQLLEPALSLLIDRRAAGAIGEERFAAACRILGENLAVDEPSLLHRSHAALKRVLESVDLPVEERRRIALDQLGCYALTGQNQGLRQIVDRDLVVRFGELETPAPVPADAQGAWLERRDEWRERIEGLPESAFLPDAANQRAPLLLSIADLRLDEGRGEVTLVDCRSAIVVPGSIRSEIGADLEERGMRLDPYDIAGRPEMFRFQGGSVLEIGRPIARRLAHRWRRSESIISPGRLGPLYADRPQSVIFESLAYLERAPEEGAEEDAARPLPAPGDSPAELMRKLECRIVADFASAQASHRRDFLQVFSRFRLRAALPPLVAAFETRPDTEIARALLAIGDHRGRDLLLAAATPGAREAVDILVALLRAGDPAALEATLGWIAAPPPRTQGSVHPLIQALDLAIEDPRLAPHLDETRVLGALVSALDEPGLSGIVMPILIRRTGFDHGYYDAFQIQDQPGREAALAESFARWRTWWQERSSKGN